MTPPSISATSAPPWPRQGKPIGPYDLQIAAIARAHGLIVVTHNTREFARVPGLMLEDWQIELRTDESP
jgi:hypothetical protein